MSIFLPYEDNDDNCGRIMMIMMTIVMMTRTMMMTTTTGYNENDMPRSPPLLYRHPHPCSQTSKTPTTHDNGDDDDFGEDLQKSQ